MPAYKKQPLRKSLALAALLMECEARASEKRPDQPGRFTEAGRELLGSAATLRRFAEMMEEPTRPGKRAP